MAPNFSHNKKSGPKWFIFWPPLQGAYQNDHQPSLIRMVVLKVKDIASRETEGRVHTDDLENTLGYAFLQAY